MSETIRIVDLDVFHLTYDEPNKEENWAQISRVAPWAERIDGVKGFDNAHKACANASETERFITIDGDNQVDPKFFDLVLELPTRFEGSVLSWAGYNAVNGLCYGNGGVKCWTRDFVLGMNTHENANEKDETVDFCWDDKYIQMDGSYSTTYINTTPYQAFRAGFREGVKLCLNRGRRVDPSEFKNVIWEGNQDRLSIWISIGSDVENGLWAMYGTALGAHSMTDPEFDHDQISDFDWFDSMWEKTKDRIDGLAGLSSHDIEFPGDAVFTDPTDIDAVLYGEITNLCSHLRADLGLIAQPMDPDASEFFRNVYHNPHRSTLDFEVHE